MRVLQEKMRELLFTSICVLYITVWITFSEWEHARLERAVLAWRDALPERREDRPLRKKPLAFFDWVRLIPPVNFLRCARSSSVWRRVRVVAVAAAAAAVAVAAAGAALLPRCSLDCLDRPVFAAHVLEVEVALLASFHVDDFLDSLLLHPVDGLPLRAMTGARSRSRIRTRTIISF